MTLPLAVLAVLSVIGGWVGVPGASLIERFLSPVFDAGNVAESAAAPSGHGLEIGLAVVSVAVAAAGWFVAYLWYSKRPGTATALAERFKPLYAALDHKYWVDEFYANFLIAPLLMLTRITEFLFDQAVVDGSGAAAGAATRGIGSLLRRQISGNIRSYAGWLAIGAAIVLAVMTFGRSLWGHS
jgi:NADH-quinone oxidoreductase subunit L